MTSVRSHRRCTHLSLRHRKRGILDLLNLLTAQHPAQSIAIVANEQNDDDRVPFRKY